MGKMARLFKSVLQIMTFDCFVIGTSSKNKKKMFPDVKEKRLVKPSNNIKVGVKPSKSIHHMDVDPAMEIHFAEETIVDILSRLPVQSLLRFKCASKFWKTLISDPYFMAKHCTHAKNNKKILIAQRFHEGGTSSYCSSLSLSSAQPLQKLPCPSNHKPCSYIIVCCCDGLFLLWSPAGNFLWNPSTNESVELPDLEFPSTTCCTYGLGFDPISDDYKILMVDDHSFGSTISPNKICALKSCSWRNIDSHPRGVYNRVRPESSLAFVRGAFHWISEDNLSKYFMISFNISNEVYGEISLPEGICDIPPNVIYGKRAISVLEGMLCAYCTLRERGMGTFKLWVMKDYGVEESWNEVFSIRESLLTLAMPKYRFADGEVLLYFEEENLYRGFRSSKGPYELLAGHLALLQGFVYTESFISPKLLI